MKGEEGFRAFEPYDEPFFFFFLEKETEDENSKRIYVYLNSIDSTTFNQRLFFMLFVGGRAGFAHIHRESNNGGTRELASVLSRC